MHSTRLLLLAALTLPLAALAQPGAADRAPAAHGAKVPAYVTQAVNDPARAADHQDDARRKLAEVLAFTGIKPGGSVLELVPGGGYWTRAFSQVVGAKGHVYTVWPNEMQKYSAKALAGWRELVKTPHYANVSLLEQAAAMLSAPQKVDVVFTSENYHDYHDPFMGPADMGKFNHQVFDALKPGGVFVVIDHAAPAGSGAADTESLHRIDPALVKQEVEAAGFVFDGSSTALQNPADPMTASVFDKSIRGHTNQFIYRFRKPAK